MGIDSLKEGGVSENSHVGLVESVNCHLSLHLSNPYCICSSTTYIIDTCSKNRLHAIRISKLPHLERSCSMDHCRIGLHLLGSMPCYPVSV